MSDAQRLNALLISYSNKRVCVIGPTCCGKTALLKEIPTGIDMDTLLFTSYKGKLPLLNAAEQEYVCRKPWTAEIGEHMMTMSKERIVIQPGHPVFGTIALDCEVYVYLKIDDELLEKRCVQRNVSLSDAKGMRAQIEEELSRAKVPVIEFLLADQNES